MEAGTISKKKESKRMGKSMRQRGLAFMYQEDSESVGSQMQECGTNPANKKQFAMPRCGVERNDNMEAINISTMEANKSNIKKGHEISVADQGQLRGQWPSEKENQLTPADHRYLLAYMQTGSPSSVAKAIGVKNVKEVSKRITKIARRLGFTGSAEMKRASGVNLHVEESATHTQLMELLQRQGFQCALTGEELVPTTARLDHKQAVSRGGTHDVGNLQWVTDEVNRAKGTMSNDQFIAVCKRVAIWAR